MTCDPKIKISDLDRWIDRLFTRLLHQNALDDDHLGTCFIANYVFVVVIVNVAFTFFFFFFKFWVCVCMLSVMSDLLKSHEL